MQCEQARQLFDAYLDGELSPALATELGAHRLRCAECRRALALLEVSGHILSSDNDPVSLSEGFEDRLLGCMEEQTVPWVRRARRGLYVAVPLAAAAVVMLAFLGVFDPDRGEVAGLEQERAKPMEVQDPAAMLEDPLDALLEDSVDPATLELDRWGRHVQENLKAKRQSGASLQKALDLKVQQVLGALEQANETSTSTDHPPGGDAAEEPAPGGAVPAEDDNAGDG